MPVPESKGSSRAEGMSRGAQYAGLADTWLARDHGVLALVHARDKIVDNRSLEAQMFGTRRSWIQLSISASEAALLLCVACRQRPSRAPSETVVPRLRPSLTTLSTGDSEIRQLQALTCNSAVPCCVHDVLAAGTDVQGHRLRVATVSEGSCIDDGGPQPEKSEEFAAGCDRYWLATENGTRGLSVAWLGEECPNARLEMNTSVDDRARTFTHSSRSLFSNERTETTITIALAPLHLQAFSASRQSFSHSRTVSWNFDEFAGGLNFGVGYCARQPTNTGTATADHDTPEIEVAAVAIPRVELPVAFRDGGWRSTRLSRCGAHIAGAKGGFTIAGGPARTEDIAFVALLSADNDLFVEIDDARFSGKTAGKILDELQIWLATPEPCVDPSHASTVRKLAIRVADGRVVTAPSATTQPVVEVEKLAHAARVRVRLGELIGEGDRLTVSYTDARVHRTIASSAFEPGKWWTLGQALEFPKGAQAPWLRLSCALDGDTLVPISIAPSQH